MNFIDEYNQKKVTAVFEREDAVEHFTWNSWHFSDIERQLAAGGLAFYAPITYSELPRYYRDMDYPSNVVNVSSCTDRLQWLF